MWRLLSIISQDIHRLLPSWWWKSRQRRRGDGHCRHYSGYSKSGKFNCTHILPYMTIETPFPHLCSCWSSVFSAVYKCEINRDISFSFTSFTNLWSISLCFDVLEMSYMSQKGRWWVLVAVWWLQPTLPSSLPPTSLVRCAKRRMVLPGMFGWYNHHHVCRNANNIIMSWLVWHDLIELFAFR